MTNSRYIESGQTFSWLTALESGSSTSNIKFLCRCGREVVRQARIVKGSRPDVFQTCGCKGRLMPKRGDRFSRLTLLEDVSKTSRRVRFLCDCGDEKEIVANQVITGKVKSCGCLVRKHEKSWSPAWRVWVGMRNRCSASSGPSYRNYSSRGIAVCDEWEDFEVFYRDMGDPPPGQQLDRMDNSLGYFKENCRWIPRVDNMNNKRTNRYMTCFGETKSMADWARDPRCLVGYGTLNSRTQNGWTDDGAITTPPYGGKR